VNDDVGAAESAERHAADGPLGTPEGESILASHVADPTTLRPEQQHDVGAAYLAAREFNEWRKLHPLPETPDPWINCSTPWRKLVVGVVVALAAISAFEIATKAILLLDPPKRCSDFSTKQAAQAYFDNSGPQGNEPPPLGTRTSLDEDGDGVACESLP
jgi:hypothetical protein